MNMSATLDLIYDGQCAGCVQTAKRLARLDVFHRLHWHDCRDEERIERLFPMVKFAGLLGAICLVTEYGEMFSGFFALRRLAWSTPWLWPLLLIFYFPGAAQAGPKLYDWIARHRHPAGCDAVNCAPVKTTKPLASSMAKEARAA